MLLLLPLLTNAQQVKGYVFDPPPTVVQDEQTANDYLTDFLLQETSKQTQWKFDYVKNSPIGSHYAFIQEFQGVPIFKTTAKVNTLKTGKAISVSYSFIELTENNTKHINQISPTNTKNNSSKHTKVIKDYIKKSQLESIQEVEPIWYYLTEKDKLVRASKLWLMEEDSGKSYQIILQDDGTELNFTELQSYYTSDTTAQALVFLPDPLTSAEKYYVPPYLDNDDEDSDALNAERFPVEIEVTYEDGFFFLKNPYIIIDDNISSPKNDPPPVNSDGNFRFTRSQSGFEDVNVLYHITEYQKYIQSLGFDDLCNKQLKADPHAANGEDNSYFSYGSGSILFGEGGVDDAEDADVIIHEYGHALSQDASPNSNIGADHERLALDEAYGDYFAVSYGLNFSDFRWNEVYTWDGHNEYWGGRDVNTDKHYPEDLSVSPNKDIYQDSEIFSAALMDIHEELGPELADKLVLQSLYFNTGETTFQEAALNVLTADEALFDGANRNTVLTALCGRGLIELTSLCDTALIEQLVESTILNKMGFMEGLEDPVLLLPLTTENVEVSVVNMNGQLVDKWKQDNNQAMTLPLKNYGPGIYIVTLKSNNEDKKFKLVKAR